MYKLAELSESLRQWREAAGHTQVTLAAALGIKQQTVSDWERGASRPHISRARALDAALKLADGTTAAALQGAAAEAAPRLDPDEELAALDAEMTPEKRARWLAYGRGLLDAE